VPNSVGKMNIKCYTEQVLPQIIKDLKERGLALYQDKDSAHASEGTKKWAEKYGLKLITGPGNSPDFSIIESMAQPLKNLFHIRRVTTQKAGFKRFKKIFYSEMDDNQIREFYK
jgi:transposase InsO family protein